MNDFTPLTAADLLASGFTPAHRALIVEKTGMTAAQVDAVVDQPGDTECKKLVAGLLAALINCMSTKTAEFERGVDATRAKRA